jgi:protease-4
MFFPRENTLAEAKAQLDMARADSEVKAVVLRVSSPGGEVTACDVLHSEVKRFREETGVPVVSCITDVGASGGYYVAVAGDPIYAQPTAMVGSIGVLLQSFDVSGLLDMVGVASAPVKSSPMKDLNSPLRAATEEERKVLQQLVDDLYARFVDVVAEGRPQLTREEVLRVADGRVVSASEAASLKMVDKVGYLRDAIDEARKRAEIASPTIVRYTRVARAGANVYTGPQLESPPSRGVHLRLDADFPRSPRLYYLWQPNL